MCTYTHAHASRTLRPWLLHPLHGTPALLGGGSCEGVVCVRGVGVVVWCVCV